MRSSVLFSANALARNLLLHNSLQLPPPELGWRPCAWKNLVDSAIATIIIEPVLATVARTPSDSTGAADATVSLLLPLVKGRSR